MGYRKRKLHGDESGYVVVETVGAFIPFVLLVVSIISLVNIVTLQARVHYALTQAANTLSVYSYTLEVLGVANDMTALSDKASRVAGEAGAMKSNVNSVLNGLDSISGISGAAEGGAGAMTRVFGWGEETAGDPAAALGLLMNYGLDELRNKVFEELARPLVGRYLASADMTGDAYLRSAGVVNRHTGAVGLEALEFHDFRNFGLGNSVLIDSNGNVKLVVEYEILYTFGGLRLPFSPTLRITQTAVTKAWLNGSGAGYR